MMVSFAGISFGITLRRNLILRLFFLSDFTLNPMLQAEIQANGPSMGGPITTYFIPRLRRSKLLIALPDLSSYRQMLMAIGHGQTKEARFPHLTQSILQLALPLQDHVISWMRNSNM
jgi:hypothetical protein